MVVVGGLVSWPVVGRGCIVVIVAIVVLSQNNVVISYAHPSTSINQVHRKRSIFGCVYTSGVPTQPVVIGIKFGLLEQRARLTVNPHGTWNHSTQKWNRTLPGMTPD